MQSWWNPVCYFPDNLQGLLTCAKSQLSGCIKTHYLYLQVENVQRVVVLFFTNWIFFFKHKWGSWTVLTGEVCRYLLVLTRHESEPPMYILDLYRYCPLLRVNNFLINIVHTVAYPANSKHSSGFSPIIRFM